MKVRGFILWVLFAMPLILGFIYLREFLAVDTALDSGASYDYSTGAADYSQRHPYISFYDRHVLFTWLSLASCGAACALLLKPARPANASPR